MTATLAQPSMSADEYLAFEGASPSKHEYWHGEVFAMAGASRRHNLLVSNLVRLLGNALLHRPCEVYPSDMRVGSAAGDVFTYPDVTVICGEPQFAGSDTLLNPLVIVEVLSDSTETYDRGKKFEHYRRIGSVQHYLLVAQNRALIEHYARQSDGTWAYADHRIGDTVALGGLGCELTVAEVYVKVLDTDAG